MFSPPERTSTIRVAQAQAVWEGMRRRLTDVALLDVAHAPRRLPSDLELLVVGAPTQAFGMSRPSTREDARRTTGEEPSELSFGVREWLRELEPPERPVHAATAPVSVDKAGSRRPGVKPA